MAKEQCYVAEPLTYLVFNLFDNMLNVEGFILINLV